MKTQLPTSASQPSSIPKPGQVRLSKYLAAAGVAARRKSEELITSGHVTVNGRVVNTLPAFVTPGPDHVKVDGHSIGIPQQTVLYAFNKPRGVISTLADERGKTNLVSYLPKTDARLFPVGRLDEESEGLLLLTNDGPLAQKLTHPRYQHAKRYRVWVEGSADRTPAQAIQAMSHPRSLADRRRGFDTIDLIDREGNTLIVEVSVHEGLTHLVRRLMDAAGYTVTRLVRIAHGPYELGDLKSGEYRQIEM